MALITIPQAGPQPRRSRTSLPACPPGVEIATLDNGLTLIVREDHSAPVVSAQAWCRTGSIHEGRWLGAGLSHVLEHMLFKGTTTRPAGRIDQEVQEAGGYMNAYTSFDRTVYYINVPNTGADTAIAILCDIMQNATLPDDELAKELDVIRREMDMNQDDPGRRASRRLFETAYTVSPYRYTIIGYPDIFNELKPADIRHYYRERYTPNNLVFVLVGDLNAPAAIDRVRKAFAQTKARALPPVFLPPEPPQTAPRELIEETTVELTHTHLAWHIPDLRHPDVPLLDIVSTVLGNGRSSRLYQQIREKLGLVHYIDAWTYSPGETGLLGVSAVCDPGQLTAARDAIFAEIERLQHQLLPAAELAKAVKQFVSATLATRKTMQGQAQDLGSNWLATGDLNFSQRYLDAVKAARPADIRRVARHYLAPENRTLYALTPTGTAPKAQARIETVASDHIQLHSLDHGLRVLLKEDRRLPFVEIRTVFQGGALAETPANNGISQIATRLLLKGTRSRSADQIATAIESVGGSIDSYAGNNSLGVNLEVLEDDLDLGIDLLADVLLRPSFPAKALEREREVQLASIKANRDDLLKSASLLMRRRLFGTTAYGLDTTGTEESVRTIDRDAVVAFHRQIARADNCVLAIYGQIDTARTLRTLRKAFAAWKSTGPRLAVPPPAPAANKVKATKPAGNTLEEQRADKKQAVLVMGFPGLTFDNPDRYALDLIQEACSDLGSRLFMRIREKLGLAYYVGAQHMPGLVPGFFAFYAGTEPAKADKVQSELLAEARLLCTDGMDDAELARAKSKLLGNHKIARQELGHLASTTALDELYGLGFDNHTREDQRLEQVTPAQIRAAARKYLRPELAITARVLGQDA